DAIASGFPQPSPRLAASGAAAVSSGEYARSVRLVDVQQQSGHADSPDALAPYRRRAFSLTVVDGDSVGGVCITLSIDRTHFVTPGFNSLPDVITNFTRALKPFLLGPDER